MKHTTLLGTLACAALLLSGCDGIFDHLTYGMLTVNQAVSVTVGAGKKAQVMTLPAGAYAAKLNVSNGAVAKLEVQVADKEQDILMAIPTNASLPYLNGELRLSAAQMAQSFDLAVHVATNVVQNPSVRALEACSISRPIDRCEDVVDAAGHRQRSCTTHVEIIQGMQDVECYTTDTHTQKLLTLLAAGTDMAVAQFNGVDDSSSRTTTYQGMCVNVDAIDRGNPMGRAQLGRR